MVTIMLMIIGCLVGYFYRDLKYQLKELGKILSDEEPEIGVTAASYGVTKGYITRDSDIGIAESKTPEQLEWQATEELRQKQFEVNNGRNN